MEAEADDGDAATAELAPQDAQEEVQSNLAVVNGAAAVGKLSKIAQAALHWTTATPAAASRK